MNKFYHAFVPGFNLWYALVPAMFIVAILLGRRCARVIISNKKDGGATLRIASRTANVVIGFVLGTAMTLLVIHESSAGLLQFLDNTMGSGDPTGVFALFGTGIGIAVIWAILCFAYMATSFSAKERHAQDLKHQLKHANIHFKVTRYRPIGEVCHLLIAEIKAEQEEKRQRAIEQQAAEARKVANMARRQDETAEKVEYVEAEIVGFPYAYARDRQYRA